MSLLQRTDGNLEEIHRIGNPASEQDLWLKVVEEVRKKIPPQSFRNWFEPTCLCEMTQSKIEIGVPNPFFADWFQDHFIHLIQEELYKITLREYEIAFRIGAVPEPNPSRLTASENDLAPQIESHVAEADIPLITTGNNQNADLLNPKYTFENFVVGASNQFAHAAAFAVAEQPAGSYNPLFIYGGVGLGKTHLLNAIGNHILKKNSRMRICYLSSEKFMNELINSIRYEKMDQFRKKYRDSCHVLLMDDIQFIAGKDRTQDEFFHTFNTLHGSGRQIVVTSDKFPKEISGLEERLRSRFEWGLIADIQPPEMETRIAILKNKAESDDIYLPDDVAIFLASHIKTNIRELEGSLIRIGAFASLTGMEVTVDLAKDVLKNIIQDKGPEITVESIQKAVANFYNIKMQDLKSKKKLKALAYPRQVAMFLSRKHTKNSFPEIGKMFGGKDHSTVMHAVKKISKRSKEDLAFRKDLEALERLID